MTAGAEWGPLARLAGIWEGNEGEDVAFSNEKGEIGVTPYREHTEFKPFGPVENGVQTLLRASTTGSAALAPGGKEENPFHTEALATLAMWDAHRQSGHASCFLIPRGSALIARGPRWRPTPPTHPEPRGWASGDLRLHPLQQLPGRPGPHTIKYHVNIDLREEGVFTYEETSLIEHGRLPEHLSHTDRNTLRRIADA